MFRIGQAIDIHAFEKGKKLMIGGVEIEYEYGLKGHSDADVLLHAIAESLLGALALGDLGKHFPDTDPRYKGMDSSLILSGCFSMIKERGYEIGNVDASVLAEKPHLAKYIPLMRQKVAQLLECSVDQISIKATRGEGLGFIGRKEGILASAVTLIKESE